MTNAEERNRLFGAMRGGKPFASYKKTILGKVYIAVWDSFSNAPTGLLLTGDPKKNIETSIIDTWDEKEDIFFKKMNSALFEDGILIPFTRKEEEVKERSIEMSTDEELEQLLMSKFFSIQSKLNSITTLPVLFRLVDKAREMEKSEKIIKAIEARIAEIQASEYQDIKIPTVNL